MFCYLSIHFDRYIQNFSSFTTYFRIVFVLDSERGKEYFGFTKMFVVVVEPGKCLLAIQKYLYNKFHSILYYIRKHNTRVTPVIYKLLY